MSIYVTDSPYENNNFLFLFRFETFELSSSATKAFAASNEWSTSCHSSSRIFCRLIQSATAVTTADYSWQQFWKWLDTFTHCSLFSWCSNLRGEICNHAGHNFNQALFSLIFITRIGFNKTCCLNDTKLVIQKFAMSVRQIFLVDSHYFQALNYLGSDITNNLHHRVRSVHLCCSTKMCKALLNTPHSKI